MVLMVFAVGRVGGGEALLTVEHGRDVVDCVVVEWRGECRMVLDEFGQEVMKCIFLYLCLSHSDLLRERLAMGVLRVIFRQMLRLLRREAVEDQWERGVEGGARGVMVGVGGLGRRGARERGGRRVLPCIDGGGGLCFA